MAYDKFDSLTAAKAAYKRCRTNKIFILTDPAQHCCSIKCAVCNKPLCEDPPGERPSEGYRGNRCEYLARLKKCVVRHYLCAWADLMRKVTATTEMF